MKSLKIIFSFSNLSKISLVYSLFLISTHCNSQPDSDNTPILKFGDAKNGITVPTTFLKDIPDSVQLVNKFDHPLENHEIISGIILAEGVDAVGHILSGGELSQDAHQLLISAKANVITIKVKFKKINSEIIQEASMVFIMGLVPNLMFGEIENGDTNITLESIQNLTTIKIGFFLRPDLDYFFSITGGSLTIEGIAEKGLILKDGILDQNAIEILKNSSGKQVTFIIRYIDHRGITKTTGLVFNVI